MQNIIIEIINQFGYFGIFFLITIENIFPPIPSEIILTFGGFMTTHTHMNVWGVIAAATIGSVTGAILLYSIGRVLNTDRLAWLFDSRLGAMLRLKKEDVKTAEQWFIKYGGKAVFFCRFVPIVRSLISIPAGTAKMKLQSFLPLTITGTFIWNVVLVFLGRIAGDAWLKIAAYIDLYTMIALVLFASVSVVAGIIFIKRRFLGGSIKTSKH